MRLPLLRKLALMAGFFVFTGCATYQSQVSVARDLLENGQVDAALAELEPRACTTDGDQLVYLLDYATALQVAGRYRDSVNEFLRADRLSEELDYHSVSRVTGSLLLSEEMKQYKGDTFEKIFINAQLAMNFLELGEMDSALVEARRINEKYQKLRQEEKQSFEMNPFAKYLSAVIWEATRRYDDASIAYNEAYKLDPTIEGIQGDLIRSAKLSRRMDEYKKWKREFPNVEEPASWYDGKMSEVIVIYQQGWGPRKAFDPADYTWPILRPVYSGTRRSEAVIGESRIASRFIYNVEQAAIRTLIDDRASLVARRLGAAVTKEVVAQQIRKDNELWGAIAWLAMHASDRADLRQWSTLPESIQIIRVRLKAGTHDLVVQGLDSSGNPTNDRLERSALQLKPGERKFVVWRTLK